MARLVGQPRRPDQVADRVDAGLVGAQIRIDHDVGRRQVELTQQARGVARHVGERVRRALLAPARDLPDGGGRRRDVGRAAAVAVVEPHDVEPAAGELRAELVRPADHLGRETHDEEHRRIVRVAELLVAELDLRADATELLGHEPGTLAS